METRDMDADPLKSVADTLFKYIFDVMYEPALARLDIESLPESFQEFGKGLQFLCKSISETRILAREMAIGNLNCELPSPNNEIAASLKMLNASLKHLTWQTQQVAKGDYNQRVHFMGDFSEAFNNMIDQLNQRHQRNLSERTKLEMYVNLIIMNCPNPILLFDSKGRLAYASDSYFNYCSINSIEDVMGKKIYDLFAPFVSEQSLRELIFLYENAFMENNIYKTELDIDFRKQGKWDHFNIQITPMLHPNGNSEGIIIFLFDTTDTMAARREAEQAREHAERSSRSKSNFLARMSHEIRTPMNAIIGMTELALREDVPAAAQEQIYTIKQAGINLLSIVNDILDFSKIETGKLEIIPADYLLSVLIYDVINIAKMRIHGSRLRFIVFLDSNIPNLLNGDLIRIRQILLNLLTNAIKYTKNGFVSLTVSRGESTDPNVINLVFEVVDSGIGIKQEEINRLFREFERFDIEKNRGIEGTGLGLAITQNLVTAMNGRIDVVSEYGKGSTFRVSLPQKISKDQKIAAVENPEKLNILIYERREITANSMIRTMKNMGIKYRLVSSSSDFYSCICSNDYTHAIMASNIYEKYVKDYPDCKTSAKFALVSEFGEALAGRNFSILTAPIFSVPLANFLNGFSDNYSNKISESSAGKFTAPDAKVLVVDDISTNLEVAEGLLLPYLMKVDLCKSGLEAIEAVKQTQYDLVLMDHMMPGMDGLKTLINIRELGAEIPYCRDLPVIAMTAVVSSSKEKLIKKGYNDFLSKPIDVNKLNQVLEKWIPKEKQKATAGEINRAADEENYEDREIIIDGVDTEKGIAKTGGKPANYVNILSIFYRDGIDKIREIKTSLETDNLPLYVIYVHALKSASAIIGADSLSESAEQLEEAGKQRDLAFIHSHNPVFIEDLEKILRNINTAMQKEQEEIINEPINMELLKPELINLKKALIAFDSSEINRASNVLQSFSQEALAGESVKKVLLNKLIGNYDEAVILINNLLTEIK